MSLLGVAPDGGRDLGQERPSPDAEYRYEPVSLGAETPPRILWTVLDRLTERLGERGA